MRARASVSRCLSSAAAERAVASTRSQEVSTRPGACSQIGAVRSSAVITSACAISRSIWRAAAGISARRTLTARNAAARGAAASNGRVEVCGMTAGTAKARAFGST
mgnify:CR=1 FL=1